MPTPPTDPGHEPDKAPDPAAAHPPGLPFVWRCYVCGRRESFGAPDLNRYLRDGWPVCCGEKALFFLTALELGRQPAGG